MRTQGVLTIVLSMCAKALGQVELPALPYAQDALEPYISEEVRDPKAHMCSSLGLV